MIKQGPHIMTFTARHASADFISLIWNMNKIWLYNRRGNFCVLHVCNWRTSLVSHVYIWYTSIFIHASFMTEPNIRENMFCWGEKRFQSHCNFLHFHRFIQPGYRYNKPAPSLSSTLPILNWLISLVQSQHMIRLDSYCGPLKVDCAASQWERSLCTWKCVPNGLTPWLRNGPVE